jgi:hypothetical protein
MITISGEMMIDTRNNKPVQSLRLTQATTLLDKWVLLLLLL